MRATWGVVCFLLLTMVADCKGRNAAGYFQEARFQYSPSRPEDALVLLIRNVLPVICEPDKSGTCDGVKHGKSGFSLDMPHGFSRYICFFEGNGTKRNNIALIKDIFNERYTVDGVVWIRVFGEQRMYCTTDSQLPDEYFHMIVQRPHEDHVIKCHFLKDKGTFHIIFPGYPTITCYIGDGEGRYNFTLPGIDDPFTCAFRVYSELRLGDTRTEERLYQALISGLPARVDGARPRVFCSRHAASNETAQFQLRLHSGATYDCNFPKAAPHYLAQSQYAPQN